MMLLTGTKKMEMFWYLGTLWKAQPVTLDTLWTASILKGQSHELRMRDFLPLGALTQSHAVISRHYRYGFVGNMK